MKGKLKLCNKANKQPWGAWSSLVKVSERKYFDIPTKECIYRIVIGNYR